MKMAFDQKPEQPAMQRMGDEQRQSLRVELYLNKTVKEQEA